MKHVLAAAPHGAGPTQRFFARMNAKAATADLYIYDVIGDYWGGVTAKAVADCLDKAKGAKTLNVFINSPGGDVFESMAIYNLIKRFDGQKNVHIDGLAASGGSVVAMAGDKIITAHNAMWMIHNAWGVAIGEKKDMLKAAEKLEQIGVIMYETYAKRTGQKVADIQGWCDAETWMDAKTAKERGFSDETSEDEGATESAMASFSILDSYKNTPDALRVKARHTSVKLAEMDMHVTKIRRAGPTAR